MSKGLITPVARRKTAIEGGKKKHGDTKEVCTRWINPLNKANKTMAAAVKVGRKGDIAVVLSCLGKKDCEFNITAVTFIADLNSRTKERDWSHLLISLPSVTAYFTFFFFSSFYVACRQHMIKEDQDLFPIRPLTPLKTRPVPRERWKS